MAEKKSNVVDLTEDDSGSSKDKKSKQQKAPKPPKAPQKKSSKSQSKKDDGAAKKKGGAGGVIVVLILLIIIGGFVFEEVQFNYFGARDVFIESVMKLDPSYKPYAEKLLELETYEAELDKREKTLDSRETGLDVRQIDLDNRQAEIEDREVSLTPVYRLPMSEQDLADMESLSRTYAQMDPAAAANILATLYEQQDIAAILYHMSERNRAAVLAQMDVRLAAALTEILLYK